MALFGTGLTEGRGYTLVVKCAGNSNHDTDAIVREIFAGGLELVEEYRGYLHFAVTAESMPPLSRAFLALQQMQERGQIEDYELSQTTLEAIFCQFCRQQRDAGAATDDGIMPNSSDETDGSGGDGDGGRDIEMLTFPVTRTETVLTSSKEDLQSASARQPGQVALL